MPKITLEHLNTLVDFRQREKIVFEAIFGAAEQPYDLIRFLYRYTEWNSEFGSGVAALAAKIGRSRGLFRDPEVMFSPAADRSVYVASHIFAAARDEFDDSSTEHLDTHRCLAQAFLKGTVDWFRDRQLVFISEAQAMCEDPIWLVGLTDRTATGYGARTPDDFAGVFRGLGYHLGSEVLADREFSVIDRILREVRPDLVEDLKKTRVQIAGTSHNAYHWLQIHSGAEEGGAVEAKHFEDAMRGTRHALRFATTGHVDELLHQIELGFLDFAADHLEFFSRVNLP